ncbi:hypothetical protein [Vibrio splendidus]|uniref:hypothetical protein n=1 Tax=Vibrio splendidus TaxID=29497 RepID=UPI002057EDAA|nr:MULTISPECIES: hypothetical protein [Vibrio]UPR50679.1 hypothetical protein ITG13_17935 [Vibrio cyclitrophicus]UXA00887.1 hypothetical protein IM698_22345 [Vibrio splendidus]
MDRSIFDRQSTLVWIFNDLAAYWSNKPEMSRYKAVYRTIALEVRKCQVVLASSGLPE